jgi:hypothetical protein
MTNNILPSSSSMGHSFGSTNLIVLTSASSTYQHTMDMVFIKSLNEFIDIFFDYISINIDIISHLNKLNQFFLKPCWLGISLNRD